MGTPGRAGGREQNDAVLSDSHNSRSVYSVLQQASTGARELSQPKSPESFHLQRELTRVRMAQTLRGDLTTEQEANLIELLAAKVSAHRLCLKYLRG